MDVFISWSGEASHIVALALKDWLPAVIQSTVPFLSSENIGKGKRWFSEIGTQLEKSNFGIICLTPENYQAPWILFEAGAISRSIKESCVAPILIGMQVSDLEGDNPLAQFNAALSSKDDIFKLVKSINESIDATTDHKLETQVLETIFEALWPKLEIKISEAQALIMKKPAKTAIKPRRQMEDLLEELIELSRSNSIMLNELPAKISGDSKIVDRMKRTLPLLEKQTADLRHIIKLRTELTYLKDTIDIKETELTIIKSNNSKESDPEKKLDVEKLYRELIQLKTRRDSMMAELASIDNYREIINILDIPESR